MLIIRHEQLDAMAEARWSSFKGRVARHLVEVLPAETAELGDSGLAPAIDRYVQAARELGLTTERDVSRYVDLFVALGPSIGDNPLNNWLGPILGDQDETPSDRLSRAYGQLPARSPAHEHLAAWWVA